MDFWSSSESDPPSKVGYVFLVFVSNVKEAVVGRGFSFAVELSSPKYTPKTIPVMIHVTNATSNKRTPFFMKKKNKGEL